MLNLEQEFKKEKKTESLADPIGRAIITKIIENNSISISDLPLDKQPSISTLARLYKFEEWDLLKSKFETNKDSAQRKFYPTDLLLRITKLSI